MESWQKEHIRNNLVELKKNTFCNSTLLDVLQSKRILSDGDIQKINSAQLALCKTTELYYILFTRQNSYLPLIEALKETHQTGALAILLPGCAEKLCELDHFSYDQRKRLELERSDCKVFKGTFGLHTVAVKIQRLDLRSEKKLTENKIYQQIKILSEVDGHSNIIQSFISKAEELVQEFCHVALIFEFCENNLDGWMLKHSLQENLGLHFDMIRQISNGVEYLHQKQIVHLNLRPTNLLIKYYTGHNVCVKIANFANAKDVTTNCDVYSTRMKKNKDWLPQETLQGLCRLLNKETNYVSVGCHVDIFSLGCIFYYILSEKHHPFGNSQFSRSANIMKGTFSKTSPEYLCKTVCKECCRDVMEKINLAKCSGTQHVTAVELCEVFTGPTCSHRQQKYDCTQSSELIHEQEKKGLLMSVARKSKITEINDDDNFEFNGEDIDTSARCGLSKKLKPSDEFPYANFLESRNQ